MSDWKATTWGKVITLQRGVDITKAEQDLEGSIPVISSGGVASHHSEFISEGPGVIIGRKGTLGTVFYSPGAYWPHDTTLWVKDFKGNDPRFVYYALRGLDTSTLDVGSSNPTLNRNHVHPLPVNWPSSLAEQQRIAGVLGAFDDLIETNRGLAMDSRRLAQVASRAILRGAGSWDLPLPQVAGITKGFSYKGPELVDDAGMHLLNLKNVGRGGTFRFDGYKPLSTTRHRLGQVVDEGDVVISMTDLTQDRDIIARAVRVQRRGLCGIIVASLDLAIVRPLQGASREFIWAALTHPRFRDHATGYCNGTTVLHMSEEALRDFEVPKPAPSVLTQLDRSVRPLLAGADEMDAEADDLARQRDELLPLLMSGKVRVSEVEGVA